ncbi:peptide chain release factor N(5)-glutamine methyltransferase [Jannaschia sp. W003]|uniref:peptide chain release factor N(5)-glutamine methyltransferase n=1 Tax=Jannaschia sp. W003 TaxID=2867012 RepID=UPI0021A67401|nr:peptide chain release factor N(5)-glutamine methyltransferase [Jannaschia sp. W003]UWQ20823.1 peptide chain release factor N(5)-glutamine methyltransferase [Jannaschia sp. W003]
MTARDALARARVRLAAAGVPDPFTDARRLLQHHAGTLFDVDPVPDPEGFEALVARRAAREPVSHILGRRDFWRHAFRVTADVLDPRPETERLVEAALERPFRRVLDLGTGSGCILLSLLAERTDATGLGTDVSDAALAVARGNADALGLRARAEFARADWLDGIDGAFDLVVSNPPYVAEAEMAALAPELGFEPRGALTPGGDGLGAYRRIAAEAPARMTPGARLLLEIGPTQAAAVSELLAAAGFARIAVLDDLDGRNRVVRGEKPPAARDSGL